MNEEQTLSPFWGLMVRIGPAIIVALFYTTVVLHYSYTPDGTYAYLQYAKNLANGGGFSFHANEPTYGVVAPLWTLLIALGTKSGLDPFTIAKTFDILFASLSIVIVYTFSATLIQDKVYALLVALILSVDASFLHWAGSGMETSFAVILVVLVVKYAYLGDYHIAGFVAGLLTLVRPEGVLLFLVIQIENFTLSFLLGRNRRMFWTSTILYLVVVLPWLVYAYQTFGSIFPNAGIAANAAYSSFGMVTNALFDSLAALGSTQLLMIVLLTIALPLVIAKGGIGTFIAKTMPLLWVIGLLLCSTVFRVQNLSRYFVPAIPLIIMYAMWGVKQMEITNRWSPKVVTAILGAITVISILQCEVVYARTVVPRMNASVSRLERGMKPIALWLQTNSSIDARVTSPEIAYMEYVSEREVFENRDNSILSKPTRAHGSNEENATPLLSNSTINTDFVVDRAKWKNRLASDSLRSIMTTQVPNGGSTHDDTLFYTLYKVNR